MPDARAQGECARGSLATVLRRVRLELARRPPLKVALRSLSLVPEGGTSVIIGSLR